MISRRALLGSALSATTLPTLSHAASTQWKAVRSDSFISLNGVTYEAQCGANPIGIQISDSSVLRFTMVPGNGWPKDSSGAERVELAGWRTSVAGKRPIWAAWSMFYESDSWSTADWCIVKQLFQHNGQPIVHVLKPGGVLHWVGSSTQDKGNYWPTRHSQKIERGTWLNFVETYQLAPETGMGYWKSWINGRQVMEYTGALGTVGAKGCYTKCGIYRLQFQTWNAVANRPGDRVSETTAIRFANMRFGEQDLSALITAPVAAAPVEPWP